jgi:hypothetical protein
LAGLGKQGSKGRTDRSAFVRRRSSRVRGIASDVGPRPQESSRHTGRAPVELAPLYAAALTPSKGRLIPCTMPPYQGSGRRRIRQPAVAGERSGQAASRGRGAQRLAVLRLRRDGGFSCLSRRHRGADTLRPQCEGISAPHFGGHLPEVSARALAFGHCSNTWLRRLVRRRTQPGSAARCRIIG